MANGSHQFGYRYHGIFMATVPIVRFMATVTILNLATVSQITAKIDIFFRFVEQNMANGSQKKRNGSYIPTVAWLPLATRLPVAIQKWLPLP